MFSLHDFQVQYSYFCLKAFILILSSFNVTTLVLSALAGKSSGASPVHHSPPPTPNSSSHLSPHPRSFFHSEVAPYQQMDGCGQHRATVVVSSDPPNSVQAWAMRLCPVVIIPGTQVSRRTNAMDAQPAQVFSGWAPTLTKPSSAPLWPRHLPPAKPVYSRGFSFHASLYYNFSCKLVYITKPW